MVSSAIPYDTAILSGPSADGHETKRPLVCAVVLLVRICALTGQDEGVEHLHDSLDLLRLRLLHIPAHPLASPGCIAPPCIICMKH